MRAPHESGTVRSGDTEIFYRKFGIPGKTPMVIVHGASFFSYDWIDVAAVLGSDREVVAMDMRGFGDSSWSASKDYSVPTMAGDIAAVIACLGWKKAILAGHSMGGRSVAWCAAKNPSLISAAVFVDYSPEIAPAGSRRTTERIGRQPDFFESVDAAMRYHGIDPASALGREKRARYAAFLKPVAEGFQLKRDLYFRDQFKRVLETGEKTNPGVDMWQVLSEIASPALVIRGAQSDMFAPETVARVRAANPNITLVEITGGHNVAGDNPEGFAAAVRTFLDGLERRHAKAA